MPSSSWFFAGGILMPVGLIIGLKEGVSTPTGWALWTNANGRFLYGASGDADVGTTAERSVPSVTTGTSGGHTGGNSHMVVDRGYYTDYPCPDSCRSPSRDDSSVGGHSGHSVGISYRPASCRLKLIRASVQTPPPLGGIMFGTESNGFQSLFSTFNSYTGGALEAGTSTGTTGDSRYAGSTGSQSDSHDHLVDISRKAGGIAEGQYTSGGATAGGSHNHGASTPSITPALQRATVRAFEIIERAKIGGLIGMWASSGVPSGWSLVATLVDRFLYFSSTGTGAQAGNNTISVSGSTGSSSHAHSFSGSSNGAVTNISHSSSDAHNHSYSGTVSYTPERYEIKFIRYEG
jgi:hypothetical protein